MKLARMQNTLYQAVVSFGVALSLSSCLPQGSGVTFAARGDQGIPPVLASPVPMPTFTLDDDEGDYVEETGRIEGTDPGDDKDGGQLGSPLICETNSLVLNAGQSSTVRWYDGDSIPTDSLEMSLQHENGVAIGTLARVSTFEALYTAPSVVPAERVVLLTARMPGTDFTATCSVRLVKSGDLGVEDDGVTRGLVADVFPVPENTQRLPNLDAMSPVQTLVISNVDIPTRAFSEGFPGVRGLFEWFALRIQGNLEVPESMRYQFRLISDDGANLYLDGSKVIDNDGVHAPEARDGFIDLTKGSHPFRIDYYQGPRFHIALQLLWKGESDPSYVAVPPDAFSRPAE